jgi:hypothetical protein
MLAGIPAGNCARHFWYCSTACRSIASRFSRFLASLSRRQQSAGGHQHG